MPRLSRKARNEVPETTAALYDQFLEQRGNVPNMFRTVAHRPEIFETMIAHFNAIMNTGTLSKKLKELVIVHTSALNQTPYCLASHTALARNLGWTETQLNSLSRFEESQEFTDAEKAALRLAETVTLNQHGLGDPQFKELLHHFSEGEVVELLCAIGLFNYFNRFNNVLRMEPTQPGEGAECALPNALP